MSINRAKTIEKNFQSFLQNFTGFAKKTSSDLQMPLHKNTNLSARQAFALFEAQCTTRHLDLAARRMRARGESFYTIGSAGHEGNVVLGELLRSNDPCFLHYRSSAFMLRRAYRVAGETPLFDILLSLTASSEDPVSGGRHKVFGSKRLWVPPQTSTIASHLPKAVGAAIALERAYRMGADCQIPQDAIICVSFGDASANHSTAVGAFNAALWASHQNLPIPILFVCEDNGIGISVKTPKNWIQTQYSSRPGLEYVYADGLDLSLAYDAAKQAIDYCRQKRKPVFLHMRTVRLLGHAGSDVETEYHSLAEIEKNEEKDPLLSSARLLLEANVASPEELLNCYREIGERVEKASHLVAKRPKLQNKKDILSALAPYSPEKIQKEATRTDYQKKRIDAFSEKLPEEEERPRHMAMLLNWGLRDMMAKYPESILFGEDVAEKGGVYHVTAGIKKLFGAGRIFNTLLDEQSILGLAMGAAHIGLLPLPEIQYLAYYHNAEDQIRGEACSLSYFSNCQFQNGMLLRIASFAYQKGFGGHFHNDNSVAVLRDVPGLIIAVPSRGDDAVCMLKTCLALAKTDGRIIAFLEPIALYMTKDLYEGGDGKWLFSFPPQEQYIPLGKARLYQNETRKKSDLAIISYANGTYLSLRAAKTLLEEDEIDAKVLDLRWLLPLDKDAIVNVAKEAERILIVDEGRRSGGVCEAISAILLEENLGHIPTDILAGDDVYIPIGDAAYQVLPSEQKIVLGARRLVGMKPAANQVELSR